METEEKSPTEKEHEINVLYKLLGHINQCTVDVSRLEMKNFYRDIWLKVYNEKEKLEKQNTK